MKNATRIFGIIVLSIFFNLLGTAQNLVPNPGYETGGCPNTFNGNIGYNGAFPTSWSVFPSIPISATPATTDYLKTGCYIDPCSTTPHSGNAWIGGAGTTKGLPCLGLTCSPSYYGEGIKAGLTSNLAAGSTYTVSIWLKHTAGSTCDNGANSTTDGIGIWFYNTSTPPAEYGCWESGLYGTFCGYSYVVTPPQLTIPANTIAGAYQQYTFSYVSTGSFNVIGISPVFGSGTVSRYYNWDDVSVELDAPCGTCTLSGVGSTWRWNGCVSTDWFEPCNWDRQSVPTVSSNVIIPNVANDPTISGGTANCFDLTIQTGGIVNLVSTSGGVLNVVKP